MRRLHSALTLVAAVALILGIAGWSTARATAMTGSYALVRGYDDPVVSRAYASGKPPIFEFAEQPPRAWHSAAKPADVPDQGSAFIGGARNATEAAGPISWNPANGPGPLGEEIASTFRSSTYTQEVLGQETTLYRSYGGNSGPLGSFWAETPPSGPLQSQIDSALNPSWGNTAESVSSIRVPAGTEVFRGAAAPQPLAGGGSFLGGGSQVYIPHVDPSWLVR